MNIDAIMQTAPVIPVLVLDGTIDAAALAETLVDAGLPVLEVTLRTPVALQCMEAIARAVPDAIVGAGTVRSVADARAALDAGCRFAADQHRRTSYHDRRRRMRAGRRRKGARVHITHRASRRAADENRRISRSG